MTVRLAGTIKSVAIVEKPILCVNLSIAMAVCDSGLPLDVNWQKIKISMNIAFLQANSKHTHCCNRTNSRPNVHINQLLDLLDDAIKKG